MLRRIRGEWHLAVITPYMRPEVRALPKGLIDHGEAAAETAVREAFEESGVRAELVEKLGDVKYYYQRTFGNFARVFKVVSFFLLQYKSGKIGDITEEMKKEVEKAEWVPLASAPKTLSYKGEREMALRAQKWAERQSEEKS